MTYLEPTDPDAFLDCPLLDKPKHGPDYVLCPKCQGHGCWNLDISHPFFHKSHFQAHCNQCNGYGWTSEENTKCIHTLVYSATVGNCLTRYACSKCDHTEVWDSSD